MSINRHLLKALRCFSIDYADGRILPADIATFFARDLFGYYNRLERIFPKLKLYRTANARDRFEPPAGDLEQTIIAVFQFLGDPAATRGALSTDLSEELKQAGEDIEDAKRLAEKEGASRLSDVTLESHIDAASRSLAVWSWLSNARQKFVQSGKNLEELSKTVDNYEKLYKQVSPQMVAYINYLLKWFF